MTTPKPNAELAYRVRVDLSVVFNEWPVGGDRYLFDAGNDREDLGRLVEEIFGPRPGGTGPGRAGQDARRAGARR